MRWFTRRRKNTQVVYSKAHIERTLNEFEVVAVCWHAIRPDDVVWVDESYKGKLCEMCRKMNNAKNKKRGDNT